MEGVACRLIIHSAPTNELQIAHEQLKEDHTHGLSCANPKVIFLRVSVLRVVHPSLMSSQPSFEAQTREDSDFTDNIYKRVMNVIYKKIVQAISILMLPDVKYCSLFRTPEQSSSVSCNYKN